MTTEEIRNARKTFTAQLTNMIRDFESQTGTTIQAINVERINHVSKSRGVIQDRLSLLKGIFIALENSSCVR